jgi:hypothetical protein
MTIQSDNIANKTTTDSAAQIASAIEPGGSDECIPGEIVCQLLEGYVDLHSLDANSDSQKITGILKNENKGSFTVSNNGEGPNSITLNSNTVSTSKILDNSILNTKISGPAPISKGGTGKTTAPEALKALMPDQEKTFLLLHFDGVNNSTTFTDSSFNAFTSTAEYNARISTAQSKFGGSSAYFDGANDCITVANSSFFNLENYDFTIEAWVNPATLSGSGSRYIAMAQNNSGGNNPWFLHATTSYVFFTWYYSSISTSVNIPVSLPLNTWSHVAVSRVGSTCYLGVNGTISSPVSNTMVMYDSTVRIGGSYYTSFVSSQHWNGYIDEFRITRGIGLYTSSYTVPTTPFPNPTNRYKFLGTNGTNPDWQAGASLLNDFDDVDIVTTPPLDDQYLKWNSATSNWQPEERISKTEIKSKIQPGREGELARDLDSLFVATGTNQWKRMELSSWT